MTYLWSLNCGSSSIKSTLFEIPPSKTEKAKPVATASASQIGAKDEMVICKVKWLDDNKTENKEFSQSEVDYTDIPTKLLELLSSSHGSKDFASKITHSTHRIVHGSTHDKPIIVTKKHDEGLKEVETLSSFAPLHNHSAVLSLHTVLDALGDDHTAILCFDTMFHQTIPPHVYTYALPALPQGQKTPVPLRKFGFHGLSYASILEQLSNHIKKPTTEINVIVAHLGSGGSACMIHNGKSYDTSMGLTPLDGLVGGTRTGSIDPTTIFHHTPDGAEEDLSFKKEGISISKAELVMNKKSGLSALAGTSDFGLITSRIEDPKSCSKEEYESAKLAYEVYVDRLMNFLGSYIIKLHSLTSNVDGLVFSGGIGEHSAPLRKDVVKRLAWLGLELKDGEVGKGPVVEITENGKGMKAWVVQTDEEEQCCKLGREAVRI